MENRAFATCAYTEFEPETYQGFELQLDNGYPKGFRLFFDTGNPMADYLRLIAYAIERDIFVQFSSSVTQFVSDSEDFEWNKITVITKVRK